MIERKILEGCDWKDGRATVLARFFQSEAGRNFSLLMDSEEDKPTRELTLGLLLAISKLGKGIKLMKN